MGKKKDEMTSKKKIPWFAAGGAIPVCTWEPGSFWRFDGNSVESPTIFEGTIKVMCVFHFSIEPYQVMIIQELLDKSTLVGGHFETWDDFLNAQPEDKMTKQDELARGVIGTVLIVTVLFILTVFVGFLVTLP